MNLFDWFRDRRAARQAELDQIREDIAEVLLPVFQAKEGQCSECGADPVEREKLLDDIERLTKELQAALDQIGGPRDYILTVSNTHLAVETAFPDEWEPVNVRPGRVEIRQRKVERP